MDEYQMFVRSVQDTFYQVAHQNNYKHGAFKEQITKSTAPLDAISTFLASPLLSEIEKTKLREAHNILIDLQHGNPGSLSGHDLLMKILPFMDIVKIFTDDMKAQGQYVPPTLIQSYNPETRTVSSTTTINPDGHATSTTGGIIGVVPGAPEGFNSAFTESFYDLGSATGTNNGSNSAGFGNVSEGNIRRAFQ